MVNKINLFVTCMLITVFNDAVGAFFHAVQYPEEARYDADELIRKNGYPLEIHYVTTKDGYILKVQRIPVGSHCEGDEQKKKPYPLIAVHGLADSSRTLVIIRKGFAFFAADHCYDVWLPNTRGIYDSRNNTSLDPDQDKFWEFGFYEKGVYDIPAVIDYVLNKTKATQVQYYGHSEGTSAAFIFTSLSPEHSAKTIRSVHALSPIAFTKNAKSPLYTLFAPLLPFVQILLKTLGIVEFPRSKHLIPLITNLLCRLQKPTFLNPCAQLAFSFGGNGKKEFNATTYLSFYGFFPAGFSTRELLIGAQLHNSGKFARYNFYEGNRKQYGQSTPPEYPIENIRVPTYLYASDIDTVGSLEDVKHFAKISTASIIVNNTDFAHFNHFDFIFGNNVDIVNRKVLENLDAHN